MAPDCLRAAGQMQAIAHANRKLLFLPFPGLMAKYADVAVKEFLDSIGTVLVQDDRVKIHGLGSCGTIYCPQRIGHNPKSGETASLPAKLVRSSRLVRECGKVWRFELQSAVCLNAA